MCGYEYTYVSNASGVRDSLIYGVRDSFICEVQDSFIRAVQTVPICVDMSIHVSAMRVHMSAVRVPMSVMRVPVSNACNMDQK